VVGGIGATDGRTGLRHRGRWKVEGGRWKVEGGRWKVEGENEVVDSRHYLSAPHAHLQFHYPSAVNQSLPATFQALGVGHRSMAVC
jgi:hypothetical protein